MARRLTAGATGLGGRQEFWLLAGGNLLACTSTQQLVVLAVVLRDAGMSDADIGLVTSGFAWALVPATLLGGTVVARYGAVRVALAGLALSLVGFASLQFTYTSALGAAGSRLVGGIAFGLFLPAGVSFVRSRAPAGQEIAWIGYFTAAQIVPSLFAPALAERHVDAYGPSAFFLVMSLPIAAAILLTLPLLRHTGTDQSSAVIPRPPQGQVNRAAAPVGTYCGLLRDPRLIAPVLAISVSGLSWGFSSTFLALLLRNHAVPVTAFFTTFAGTVLITRFGLLRYLQRLPQLILVEIALIVVAAEFALLAVIVTTVAVIVAGVLFGLGYAVIFPTGTNWAAGLYPEAARARPIALTTSGFHLGSLLAPLLAGFALGRVGYSATLATLAVLVVAVLLFIIGQALAAEKSALPAPSTSYDAERERIEELRGIAQAAGFVGAGPDAELTAFFRDERHPRQRLS